MTENPSDKVRRGPLHALTRLWKRAAPPDDTPPGPVDPAGRDALPSRIGHYSITAKLGEGGMGIVYAARDERLQRPVAIKMISSLSGNETARKRFWREARAAASVSHPNICQLYEIGEDNGQLFLAMELLQGEALDARLQRGPLSVAETLPVGLGILAAVSALHARDVIHRDLKPSNVFLTATGVKLLDFGLARTGSSDPNLDPPLGSLGDLTSTGMVVGTPRYMAPEQVTGDTVDARTDLFSVGAILFEMLAGRPPFLGRNVVEVLHATLHEQPPALTGSPAVAAMDRVIRRALAKSQADRPQTADAMAEELKAIGGSFGNDAPALARALTRLVVLPFRVLRPDPETDFLAFSLPDAIATTLSASGSLTVRSTATAARFAGDAPDIKALAVEADVDRVVMGTLLRSGEQVQANVQLIEAPDGTLMAAHTVLASLGNLFHLQDDIVRRVVEALALPLANSGITPRPTPTPDAPHDARAYGLYLQANEQARSYENLQNAKNLYEACLELDPRFAPAWAQLARCYWVTAKYVEGSDENVARAESAIRRALELSPRLPLAHKFYANLESDTGHAQSAMMRLLGEANRHGNDPELFAGLVHACRYCGLFDQALAADREARRLDPNVRTGVLQTILMTGDWDRLLAMEGSKGVGGDGVVRVIALGLAGRREEARAPLESLRKHTRITAFYHWTDFVLAWLDRDLEGMHAARGAFGPLKIIEDPEALFQVAWMHCDAGDCEYGLALLQKSIATGYFVASTLEKSSHFDALRGRAEFQEVLARAQAGRAQALTAFRDGGGHRLLGL